MGNAEHSAANHGAASHGAASHGAASHGPGEVIGLLHPGEMGAAVGGCLAARGHEVLWAADGRGPDTAARAAAAGLTDAGTIAALAARADVIVSVCPPHAALDVAWAVHGFRGLYVDANAVAPGTAREVARLICESGGRYVDGGIIGPPPQPGSGAGHGAASHGAATRGTASHGGADPGAASHGANHGTATRGTASHGTASHGGADPGTASHGAADPGAASHGANHGTATRGAAGHGTRLYLSGAEAARVAGLFAGTPLDARVIGGPVTAASAVKMAYAGWTKGTAALLLACRALAREQGVEDALLAEWAISQPGLPDRSAGAARSAVAKGWRWTGEMDEIAAAMSGAGLPDGFHQAAAEIFRRAPRTAAGPDALDQVLGELTGDSAAL